MALQASERELAALIRQGLATPGTKEDKHIYGAGLIDGVMEANVVGLALIGKLGDTAKASELFEGAVQEMGTENDTFSEMISTLLGLSYAHCEWLVVQHWAMPASDIAAKLESGELSFDDVPAEYDDDFVLLEDADEH